MLCDKFDGNLITFEVIIKKKTFGLLFCGHGALRCIVIGPVCNGRAVFATDERCLWQAGGVCYHMYAGTKTSENLTCPTHPTK